MISLSAFLKLIAPVFFMVGVLHLVFGVGAEVMLGAKLPAESISDPVLDSQNRFYGTAFTLFGAVFYLCGTDLKRYAPILRAALLVFFAAGLARIVSIAAFGLPSALVLFLLATELVLPPVVFFWMARTEE